MKKIKNILYICTLCLITAVIGYFVYSYTQFNNGASITQESFVDSYYKARNKNSFISFGNFKNTTICFKDNYYYIDNVEYEKGIFTLTNNEDVYLISVIDKDVIYISNFNTYFYNVN